MGDLLTGGAEWKANSQSGEDYDVLRSQFGKSAEEVYDSSTYDSVWGLVDGGVVSLARSPITVRDAWAA